jgi:HAMP domain-containing protein
MASASSSARIRASAPTALAPAPTVSAVRSRWFLGRLPFALVLALSPVLGIVLGVLSVRGLAPGPVDAGRALLYTAAGVGFWVAALWWLIWRLSRALQSLERVSIRVAGGDYGPVETDQMPTSSLVALQGSLAQMVAHLREAHGALERQMHQERAMREELQSLQ